MNKLKNFWTIKKKSSLFKTTLKLLHSKKFNKQKTYEIILAYMKQKVQILAHSNYYYIILELTSTFRLGSHQTRRRNASQGIS